MVTWCAVHDQSTPLLMRFSMKYFQNDIICFHGARLTLFRRLSQTFISIDPATKNTHIYHRKYNNLLNLTSVWGVRGVGVGVGMLDQVWQSVVYRYFGGCRPQIWPTVDTVCLPATIDYFISRCLAAIINPTHVFLPLCCRCCV